MALLELLLFFVRTCIVFVTVFTCSVFSCLPLSIVVSVFFSLNSLPVPRPFPSVFPPPSLPLSVPQAIVVRYTDDQEEVSNNSVSMFICYLSFMFASSATDFSCSTFICICTCMWFCVYVLYMMDIIIFLNFKRSP